MQEFNNFFGFEPLQDIRSQFDKCYREVDTHAPEYLEKKRMLVPHDERVPEPVGDTDVEGQGETRRAVAEKGDQYGRFDQGLEKSLSGTAGCSRDSDAFFQR